MINAHCVCGNPLTKDEADVYQGGAVGPFDTCGKCGRRLKFVAAEELPPGSGIGDFDTSLTVIAGPPDAGVPVGTRFVLGGVPDLTIGKQAVNPIQLPGVRVSRVHAKLMRVDFGPGKWFLENNKSTNGVYVNGRPVDAHELVDGDVIRLGDYQLQFDEAAPPPAPVVEAKPAKAARRGKPGGAVAVTLARDGEPCPSCGERLPKNAAICTDCGIRVKTGRPIVISREFDENDFAVRSDTWIRTASWLIPFGLFPVASEAFGTKKPYAAWVTFGVTTLASIAFLVAVLSSDHDEDAAPGSGLAALLLWSGDPNAGPELGADELEVIRQFMMVERSMGGDGEGDVDAEFADDGAGDVAAGGPEGEAAISDEQVRAWVKAQAEAEGDGAPAAASAGTAWYQFFTHALLHDGPMHLAGNMLFLLVFGLRVNEGIGNVAFAVVYPALAVAAGAAHYLASMGDPAHPMLGASGAVMGLSGMYFVLYPVQRVHMAIWFRGGMLTGWRCLYKLFTMRGVWLLALWIGINDVLPTAFDLRDEVAHWAHLGGFLTGVALAVALLAVRVADARGSDVLSVALGRYAWPIVGTPAARNRRHAATDARPAGLPAAVSMSYPA